MNSELGLVKGKSTFSKGKLGGTVEGALREPVLFWEAPD